MLPREMMTVGEARKRINAIKQYSSLGAGFKIAMRDLEIRGAGNILGTQQSGHIINVGFDLYCSLLKQAVSKLKGDRVRPRVDVAIRLDFVSSRESEFLKAPEKYAPAFLPVTFVGEPQARIQAYRQLAETSTQEQLDHIRKGWRDRYGKLPEAAENLIAMNELRLVASARKIAGVEVRDLKAMLLRNGDYILLNGKFPRLGNDSPSSRLSELVKLVRSF